MIDYNAGFQASLQVNSLRGWGSWTFQKTVGWRVCKVIDHKYLITQISYLLIIWFKTERHAHTSTREDKGSGRNELSGFWHEFERKPTPWENELPTKGSTEEREHRPPCCESIKRLVALSKVGTLGGNQAWRHLLLEFLLGVGWGEGWGVPLFMWAPILFMRASVSWLDLPNTRCLNTSTLDVRLQDRHFWETQTFCTQHPENSCLASCINGTGQEIDPRACTWWGRRGSYGRCSHKNEFSTFEFLALFLLLKSLLYENAFPLTATGDWIFLFYKKDAYLECPQDSQDSPASVPGWV